MSAYHIIRRRWLGLCMAGMPLAFFIGCQDAAIDFQRAWLQALAFRLSDLLFATPIQ